MSSAPNQHATTIRAALETLISLADNLPNVDLGDALNRKDAIATVRACLDTPAAGQEWMPVDLELYEYPDGKKGLVYTSSDGYGRAQLRYLQDADTDVPKETIIILPDHLRLWKRVQPNTQEKPNGSQ